MSTQHNNKQYLDVTDLSETPTYSNSELERLAGIYGHAARIKQSMTFVEFMANPYVILDASNNWPEAVWSVDFVTLETTKMWVVNLFNNQVLDVVKLSQHNQSLIPKALRADIEKHGKPDQIIVEKSSCFNTAAVRALCRIESIKIKCPTPKRGAQLIGALDQDSREVV